MILVKINHITVFVFELLLFSGKKDDNSPHIPRGKLEERINSKPK